MRALNFKQLMFDMNINQVGLAEILGISQSSMSKIINGERSLQEHHLDRLIEKFSEGVVNNYYNHQNLETPSKMESTITIYDSETLEEIKQEIEEAESFPVLPEDVSTSPNTDILKYVEENGAELETINPNQLLLGAKVDVAERIKRTSMLPTFQPEDAVFIRFIKDKMKIVDGETYYLDCKNRPTMIRLVKFEPDGKLRLIAKNSQYGDIVIERSDVINIGVVVALFRMTFGDQYSELEELRREKEAEREKKDSQIDKMLEMMQAQGEQQSKLIDFITKR